MSNPDWTLILEMRAKSTHEHDFKLVYKLSNIPHNSVYTADYSIANLIVSIAPSLYIYIYYIVD